MELNKKVAIVTGASKGIGKAASLQLLEKGARVAGWSRSTPDFNHPNFLHIPCDVRSPEDLKSAFHKTLEHFKNIDILINNAGLGYSAPLEETSLEHFDTMFDTNVKGLFFCTQLVLPNMKKNGAGHIVNLSSIAGTLGIENMAAYCGTKHAVRGISHSLYKEVRNDGIKVTCIYPGSVNTHFFDPIEDVTANEHMIRPEDIALSIIQALESHPNYHVVDLEVRPLQPFGPKKK